MKLKKGLRQIAKSTAITALLLFTGFDTSIASTSTMTDQLKELESRVWTANDYELPELESKIVRLMQTEPSNTFYHYLMSHLSIRMLAADPSDMRLMNQASQLAQQAIDLDAKSEFGYLALAELLDLMGHAEKGVSLINEIQGAGLKPSWRIHFTLARLSVDSQSTERILELFRKSLSDKNALPKVIAPYAAAILQTSSTDGSTATLEKWDHDFPNTMFKHLIAVKQSEAGKYKQAHANYLAILNLEPNNTEALINDAILLYKHLKNNKKAISLFEKIDSFESKKVPDSVKPVFFAHMGTVLLRMNKKDDARKRFIQALRSSSNLASMMNFISTSYKEQNKNDELIAVLTEANTEIPGHALLHAYLGEIYSESLKDHKSSLEHFANAITLEPDRSEYYNAMGLAYYRLSELKDALNLFTAATKVDPSDSTAQYNRACVLAKSGHSSEALASLEIALKLDPLLEQTAANDPDFASLTTMQAFVDLLGKSQITAVAH